MFTSTATAQGLVHIGVDIHRHSAAQHQGVDDAAVDVAGEDDLVPPLAGGEDHALHGTGGAAHHEKGVGRTEGVRRQLLRFTDNGDWVAQVVQGLHAVDVQIDALLAQKGRQLRVAPAPLVAGDVKGDHPHLSEPLQGLVDGGAALIQLHLFHNIILFVVVYRENKKTQVVRKHIPAFPHSEKKRPGRNNAAQRLL